MSWHSGLLLLLPLALQRCGMRGLSGDQLYLVVSHPHSSIKGAAFLGCLDAGNSVMRKSKPLPFVVPTLMVLINEWLNAFLEMNYYLKEHEYFKILYCLLHILS